MPTAWRIVKEKHVDAAFDGEGARLFGGRWNSAGVACVYTAENISLALLEVLVHVQAEALLAHYSLIAVQFPEELVSTLDTSGFPKHWPQSLSRPQTQAIGDEWLAAGSSVILKVPNAITGLEWNYLINPKHPDVVHLDIGEPQKIPLDTRLN